MGVLSSFERKLQGAVAATFARLFGGSVHPTEVADALQGEASSHLQHQGGRTIAPNRYTVRLGPTDAGGVGQDEERVAAALSSMIREYLDEQGWQTFGDVAVTLEESDALHDAWTIPGSGRPLFEDATANFVRHSAFHAAPNTPATGSAVQTGSAAPVIAP